MKKILTLMLALILALTATACTQKKETTITGAWHTDMYCDALTLNINVGGIYTMEMQNEAMIGTWALEENTLYLDQGTTGEKAFNYNAEAQTLDLNTTRFTRKAAKAFKPDKAIKADIEDFTGSWTAAKVDILQAALPMDFSKYCMDAVIDGTHVNLTETYDKTAKECEAVFADGSLSLLFPAANETEQESVYTITMLKNGMLSIKTDTAIFYMEKTAAGS